MTLKFGEVQHKYFPETGMLPIIHPCAWIYFMSTICQPFSELMWHASAGGTRPLTLAIYADECEPGNPFRHEHNRLLQCVYWSFVEWPAHILTKAMMWPIFSCVQSQKIALLNGKFSNYMRMVLRTFFAPVGGGSNLSTQWCLIERNGQRTLIKANFGFFIEDLTSF